MVVFGQKWLYSGKRCCIRAKVLVFDESACIRTKVVVFGESGCNRAKVIVFGKTGMYLDKNGCTRAKWL